MEREKVYCPTCKKELELIVACGAANYFCNYCKKLVSSKSVQREDKANEKSNS